VVYQTGSLGIEKRVFTGKKGQVLKVGIGKKTTKSEKRKIWDTMSVAKAPLGENSKRK